jgi:hypothetical protein
MSIQDELAELLARIEPPVELKSYVAALIKNLCDNLFEEGVKLTPEVRDRLQAYCQQFRVDAGRRSLLNALTPGSTGLQSQRY